MDREATMPFSDNTNRHIGPRTEPAEIVHSMKYRSPGEDFREAMNRVSDNLTDSPKHYHAFRDILLTMRFLPGGRVQSAIGATRQTTAINCFVSGTIADSYVDGEGSIMQRAHEAAATMRMGGGIGYDFSTLRPRGSLIKKLQSQSTGPLNFMRIFNEVCLCTASSGHRRGAQMAVLRVDHPDIEEYVKTKQNSEQLTGFNISVAVTHEFMEAALGEKEFDLRFNGEVYRTVDAAALWSAIMRSTYDWAEPGVIFIDTVNEMNNLWYCETIAASNPCGEQMLPPHGACLLGSFNLVQYLEPAPSPREANAPAWEFNWALLQADIPHVVRAMDNVTDKSRYPLAAQKAEAVTKRRMGLGVTGLANAGEALGYVYGTPEFLKFEAAVLGLIRDESYRASAWLAKEKGAFPYFDSAKYLKGKFIQTLPDDIRDLIGRFGTRCSHLLSIAPTGTISMTADNVSGGLEPVFAHTQDRPINTPNGVTQFTLNDYGSAFLGVQGRLAKDVSAQEHIDVLTTAQQYVDSAVSKTVNMDGNTMSWDQFKGLYKDAWEKGAKGCSTFNSSGQRMALLKEATQPAAVAEGASCTLNMETGIRDCG
jgi:ribonucleoside-diphosphate reductase alpha chain